MRKTKPIVSSSTLVISLALCAPTQAELWQDDALPVVLTPARLKQSRHNVPASVSIIDRHMIAASGIRRIPELFRLIPGTFVGARDGWNHVVSYHGTNYRDSRRMQVLIDGRSVYQAGLATVDWNDIPLAIEDIQRIEIVRGPSTASYGANAFLGVINIITRHPDDSDRLYVKAQQGSGSTEDYLLSHAGDFEGGKYRITAVSRRDEGFDHDRNGADRRDSDNSELFNLRYERFLTDDVGLNISAGYKQGETTDDFADIDVTAPDDYVKDYFFTTKLAWEYSSEHSQQLRVDYSRQVQRRRWTAQLPPAFVNQPEHSSPLVLVDANEDITQFSYDVEFQDTLVWNHALSTVSGFHIRNNRVHSETYYNGTVSSESYQLFANAEYAASDRITANIGASWERDDNEQNHLSPRASLHFHITPRHSLRAVYSEAVRSPDLFETSADWTYTARNIRPREEGKETGKFILHASGNPNLKAENIQSREAGYYGNFIELGLQWDVKIFNDKFTRLISDPVSLERFNPKNGDWLKQRGVETEIDFRPSPQWLVHASYSYINSDTSSPHTEASFTSKNAASALISYEFGNNIQISYSRYYTENTETRNRNTFSRSDTRIAKQFTFAKTNIELAYVWYYRHDNNSELLSDNFYNDASRHLVSLSLRY